MISGMQLANMAYKRETDRLSEKKKEYIMASRETGEEE
jgi:hypothetical protein